MTKSKQTDELDDSMRILSTGTCDTLSGTSKLTYHIGSMPDGEVYLRVHSNTGGGFFSQEWISLQDILTALNKRPEGKAITSILLNPLLRGGKSANTPGFLLAVLLHEKLVRSLQRKPLHARKPSLSEGVNFPHSRDKSTRKPKNLNRFPDPHISTFSIPSLFRKGAFRSLATSYSQGENMLFTTLVAVVALCLLIPFKRMYGVIGAVITLYFYPYHTLTLLGALALGGVVFIYLNRKRKSHA